VDLRELVGLPAPVQAYFAKALSEGQPKVASVRVRHEGAFNMGETTDRWKPFTSYQRVITRPPSFEWNARIRLLPGFGVRVREAYVAGEGLLQAKLFGVFTVASARGGGDFARGELMRFFAEAAWYPTALLPSQGVRWEALDARSARATLAHGSISVTLRFSFGADALVDTVQAEARGRMVGKEIIATPWRGRFWNYAEREGMRVPLEGEVAWLLPEGEKPYWRGRITRLEYGFADENARS
jgi:hypothetical protein